MNPQAGLYSRAELLALGFRAVGENVAIHRTAQMFGTEHITVGSNVRIDCFALLSAGPRGMLIGDHVHIAVSAIVLGAGARVELADFSGLSPRATLFTSTDDFRGGYLSGPTIPEKFKNVRHGDILVGRHAIVGAGSVVLPGVTIGKGGTVGALSLVKSDVGELEVVAGVPARAVGRRDARVFELEREFLGTPGTGT